MAALKTGAAHVTGVEVRQSLVDKAEETFAFYGQDPETYRFVCGDVFEVLEQEKFDVDVVLCLGYLYHTWRYTELMYRLHNLAPRHLIVDTMVTPDTEPTLKVVREQNAEDIRSAAQDAWSVDRVLVLRPSVPALQILVRNYGFEIESMYDWRSRLAGRLPMPGLDGYATGKRVTLRCRSREAAIAGMGPGGSAPGRNGPRTRHGRARTDPDRPPSSRPMGGAGGSTRRWPKPRATSCGECPPSVDGSARNQGRQSAFVSPGFDPPVAPRRLGRGACSTFASDGRVRVPRTSLLAQANSIATHCQRSSRTSKRSASARDRWPYRTWALTSAASGSTKQVRTPTTCGRTACTRP